MVLLALTHQSYSITQYLGVFANFRLDDKAGTPHLSTRAPAIYKTYPKKFKSSYRHFHNRRKKLPDVLYSNPIKADQTESESTYYVYYTPRGPPPHYFSNGLRIPSAFTVNYL